MNALTTNAQTRKINQFVDLFQQGIDAWIRAGEILVELVEDDPHVYDYIIEQCPTLNAGVLARFEEMGRKTLHPQLLLANSPGFAKLKRLPFSMQERYVEEPIPIIVHTPEGTDVLLVKAKEMTKEQADQVFTGNRIRTEGEQKAFLMQKASNAAKPVSNSNPWHLSNDSLIVKSSTGDIRFTRSQLATFLAQLTR